MHNQTGNTAGKQFHMDVPFFWNQSNKGTLLMLPVYIFPQNNSEAEG